MKVYIDFDGVILDTDTTIDNIIKKVILIKRNILEHVIGKSC